MVNPVAAASLLGQVSGKSGGAGAAGSIPSITGGAAGPSGASNYSPADFGSVLINNSAGSGLFLGLAVIVVAGAYLWLHRHK